MRGKGKEEKRKKCVGEGKLWEGKERGGEEGRKL